MTKTTVVSTPGFLAEMADFPAMNLDVLLAIRQRLCRADKPSWIVGDPMAITPETGDVTEDGGRTLRIWAPFKFYAIREDVDAEGYYEEDFAKAEHRVTFMLPEEY